MSKSRLANLDLAIPPNMLTYRLLVVYFMCRCEQWPTWNQPEQGKENCNRYCVVMALSKKSGDSSHALIVWHPTVSNYMPLIAGHSKLVQPIWLPLDHFLAQLMDVVFVEHVLWLITSAIYGYFFLFWHSIFITHASFSRLYYQWQVRKYL